LDKSTNGTYVNSEKLEKGVKIRIKNDDRITLMMVSETKNENG
jgi:pSer/pThr/pTyr-binding forkhead associated (FHA) protein